MSRKRNIVDQPEAAGEKDRVGVHPIFKCPYLGLIFSTSPFAAGSIQQDDQCKSFYMEIVNGSLESAFKIYGSSICGSDNKIKMETSKKSVIVIGAGLAGLAAAFELEKVGYNVSILERQHRVGGRTKTLREGFSDALHAEGGAMRLPPNHYLTHGYIEKFKIPLRTFVNYNEKGWLHIVGKKQITMKEWNEKNRKYSTEFFPGWDSNLTQQLRKSVDGILDLYEKTFEPVMDELYKMIDENKDNPQVGWEKWIAKWSKLSVEDFLRSTIYPETSADYRPWPEAAIKGYQIASYSPEFGMSLVEHLRDELGQWWQNDLKTPVDGMDSIAKSFIRPSKDIHGKDFNLAKRVNFGVNVRGIKRDKNNKVTVTGRNIFTGMDQIFTADAVIVTVPLTVLRHIDIDLTDKKRRAVGNIYYGAATKIILQCKSRFWEKEVGQGGFSKTDLPIGQLHYPSPNNPPFPNERGLLVCYNWGQDALVFGAQTADAAIENAVMQVTKIHPEMKTEFEVGMVQAWFSDETAQGAYANLLPFQYSEGLKELMTPDHPIYLAGEAISYTNAWIQGALESGLNAAYHMYCHDHS